MQSVQVLRGPQGTLFGRNTPGGAVVVTTNRPGKQFAASIEQSAGNFGYFATEGYVNLPVSGDFALRLAARHDQSDGYITDVVTNKKMDRENHDAVRLSALVDTGALESLFVVDYTNIDDGAPGAYALPGSLGGAAQATRGFYQTASGLPVYQKADVWSITNRTTVPLSDAITFRNILGYRNLKFRSLLDTDGSALFLLPIQREIKQDQISDEVQLLGQHDWGNWIVGAYYFSERDNDQGRSAGTFAGCPGTGENPAITDLTSYACYSNTWSIADNSSKAVYAQASIGLGIEGLTATLGGRMSWDTRKAQIRNRTASVCRFTLDTDGNPATPEVRPSLSACQLDLSKDFSEPTYNISIEYKPTQDFLVYAAHRHGYRTGGFGARASTEAGLRRFFLPETVDDIEIGAKATWHFGDVYLQTNIAGFYGRYKDIQRLLLDPTTLPVTTVTSNAGRARIKGLELEGTLRPVRWLELSGYYSYTDAKFTSFIDYAGNDISKNPFARAPKHLGGGSVRVIVPAGAVGDEANLSVRYTHTSPYSLNVSFIPGVSIQDGYDLFNLSAGIKRVMGTGIDLSVFVDNLTDEKYSFGGLGFGTTTISTRVAAPPRTFGVRLRYTIN